MRRLSLVLFILLASVISCQPNVIPIQYRVDIRKAVEYSPDNYFCDIEYIALTSLEQSPLSIDIRQLAVGKNGYIIVDAEKTIYLVDSRGKLYSRFNHYGNGFGEYLTISDIHAIDDDVIEILDGTTKRVITYDKEGSFTGEKTLDFSPSHFIRSGKTLYFAHSPSVDEEKHQYSLFVTDDEIKVIEKHFPYKKSYSVILGPRNSFYRIQDEIVFSPTYSNCYYTLRDGKVKNRFLLDYGQNKIKEKVLAYSGNDSFRYLNHIAESGSVYFENVHEIRSYIYVDYYCSNSCYISIVNKDNGKIKTFLFKDSGVCSSQYQPLATKDDRFVSVLEPVHENDPTTLMLFSIKQF